MKVSTIPATHSFVDALADGILARAGSDPMALADYTILLPNRRACRNLREAFLRRSDGAPLLLPAIRPLGDVDEDALALGPEIDHLSNYVAMNPLRRQLILAQYLNKIDAERYPMAQALPMASELGRFLDSVHTEGLTLDNLETLVPAEYAAHWAHVLDFLKNVVGIYWPQQLERENALDPGAYRVHMVAAYIDQLQKNPPTTPIIAAGSTGSIPIVADLLKLVASQPTGEVVLPGLDLVLDDASWNDSVEEGHPQAGLQRLLNHIGITRADVTHWRPYTQTPRDTLISTLMRPASTLEHWVKNPVSAVAFEGIDLLEAENLDEESAAIAAIMRSTAQDTNATEPCVLVTPDRVLAARVAQYLTRWNIAVDDSAGVKLSHTPIGQWLLLLCDVLHENLPPVELLATLKHNLAAGGASWPSDAPPFRNFVRLLDAHILRGSRPQPGFKGLNFAVRDHERLTEPLRKNLEAGLRGLEKNFNPAFMATDTPAKIRALVLLAENLAAAPDTPGAQRLWSGDAGEATADIFGTLFEQNDVMPALDWQGVRAVLEAAMQGVSIRPRYGTHPRLAILGPIEARLYQAGTMILGGLNEGTWPKLAEVDGWMSRPMRVRFGLPAPERAITLSSHDFCQGMGAKKVILTRSKNRDGAPTIASRWLQRLDAVRVAAKIPDLTGGAYWQNFVQQLDAPEGPITPATQPQVNPPLSARPKKLSVTEIATLRSDPYAIYARHVLNLKPLDPIDAEPDARIRGTLIHEALEEFTKSFPKDLPQDALEKLLEIGREVFDRAHAHPDIYGHWWPRFVRMAQGIVPFENSWRMNMQKAWAEVKAEITLPIGEDGFTLRGRADRIEQRDDGWAVIDYKSGTAPSQVNVKSGKEPQLTLLGSMLLKGAFNESLGINKNPDTIDTLAYWPVGGSKQDFKDAKIYDDDMNALCNTAQDGLESLIRAYLEDGIPYISRPDPTHKFREEDDYAHLARVAEWSNEEEEDAA